MKRVSFDGQERAPKYQTERPALACTADGCSWTASAGYDGRMFCLAHLGIDEPKLWPAITSKTSEFKWLADFIAEIQGAINSLVPGVQWLEVADAFWHGSDYPHLAPTQHERKAPGLYLYRLHGEARSIATGRRRSPEHVPQARHADFNPRKISVESDE